MGSTGSEKLFVFLCRQRLVFGIHFSLISTELPAIILSHLIQQEAKLVRWKGREAQLKWCRGMRHIGAERLVTGRKRFV